MTKLVRLEPPYSRSGGGRRGILPITRGPRLARTRGMGRWHRPRSGIQFTADAALGARVCFTFWCGQAAQGGDVLTAADVPDGEPLCGTCEGRAIGAGHPPVGVELRVALLFEPASSKPPPPACPATLIRWFGRTPWGWNDVFPCPGCGVATKLRGAGSPYDSHVKITGHAPGHDLIEPCPFHRWDRVAISADGSTVGCACGREQAAA